MRIRGKTAIVTGASSGLGRAVALLLARRGAAVALVARRRPLLEELAAAIEAGGGRALVVPADVAVREEVRAAFEAVVRAFGTPDILINAAGVGIWKPFADVTEAEHRAMMDVNYWGAFHWIRCVLPEMKKRGRGHIVNVSSGTGKIGLAVTSGYSASKFALTGLSESLHRELLRTKLRVSCVHPGNMRTGFWNEEAIDKRLLPPLVRFAPMLSPEAVARHVGYCLWLGMPVRTLPVFVGLLTRANALWIRLGDLMLWKWFLPLLVLMLLLLFLF